MKPIIKKGIFAFFIVLVAVIFVELLARHVFFPEYADGDMYIKMAFDRLCNSQVVFDSPNDHHSRKFGFRFSPNSKRTFTSSEFQYTVRTNSLGFRTQEIRPKEANERRVLLLGDSTFWGVGVNREDMVSTLIEKFGRENAERSLSVYNYAVSGYNTVQELIVAQTYVPQLQPDFVILGIFIGNDIIPNALTFIDDHGNYAVSPEKIEYIKSKIMDRFSIFYHSITFRIAAIPLYVPRLRYQFALQEDILQSTYHLLTEFDRFMQQQGISFAVVLIYPRDAVQGGFVEKWSQSSKVGKLLHQFCVTHSITSLNLLDFMRGKQSKKQYFFPQDGHFNKAGNAFLAQIIFQQLVEPLCFSKSD